MYAEIFPSRLKHAREQSGFSQYEIEREIKIITRNMLAKYETNRSQPDIETLATLADFYNVSIDWLVGLKTDPKLH
jgi:transcriptional regulator with XRE-family HTH domain